METQGAAAKINAKGPEWVDEVTRLDGVDVSCDAKTVTYRKFIKAEAANMKPGWQDIISSGWNKRYCAPGNPVGEAVKNGWTVAHALTLADGAAYTLKITCGQDL